MRETGRGKELGKDVGSVVFKPQPGELCSMNGPTLKQKGQSLDPSINQSLAAGSHLGGGGHHPGISSRGDTVAPATREVLWRY